MCRCTEIRIVWHDLRIKPDDLPKPHSDVWGCISAGKYRFYQIVTYKNGRWTSPTGKTDYTDSIIAWCPYPVFNETES
ncbi:MAG: hypothetical protein J6Y93_03785 [Treponema sp.]|nr:hypothetical protein [Treponema sp.]